MITYKKGNLLDTPDMFIAHGCNAQGVMGSGVALAVKEKYHKAFQDYRNIYLYEDMRTGLALGRVIASVQEDDKIILNCITQRYYGREQGKRYCSYDAIDIAMTSIAEQMDWKVKFPGEAGLSMPKIGCGLGGGHWPVVEAIINHRLGDHNVTVWELE